MERENKKISTSKFKKSQIPALAASHVTGVGFKGKELHHCQSPNAPHSHLFKLLNSIQFQSSELEKLLLPLK